MEHCTMSQVYSYIIQRYDCIELIIAVQHLSIHTVWLPIYVTSYFLKLLNQQYFIILEKKGFNQE